MDIEPRSLLAKSASQRKNVLSSARAPWTTDDDHSGARRREAEACAKWRSGKDRNTNLDLSPAIVRDSS